MAELRFDIQNVLTKSWEAFAKNALFFILYFLALGAAAIILTAIIGLISAIFTMIWVYLGIAVYIILIVALSIACLAALYIPVANSIKAANGEVIDMKNLFKIDRANLIKFVAISIIIYAIVFVLYVIFNFIPVWLLGFHSMILWSFTSIIWIAISLLIQVLFFPVVYICIDKKELSIIDTLKLSYKITSTEFASAIVWVLICVALFAVGMIVFGIGLLVTMPLMFIGSALVYQKLLENKAN